MYIWITPVINGRIKVVISKQFFRVVIFVVVVSIMASCKKDLPFSDGPSGATGPNGWVYKPTFVPVPVPFATIPLPPSATPADNPQTKEGIQLGRMLFYDPILSGDSTLSCAGCHQQKFAFSDGGNRFSRGITGQLGTRNTPPLFNLVYNAKYFWDGRAVSLEDQAQHPVVNPIEMNSQWTDVIAKLQRSKIYPKLFYQAFGILPDSIKPLTVGKAIAQFVRTIVSNNSLFDQQQRTNKFLLSDDAIFGATLIQTNNPADCGHCHGDFQTDVAFIDLAINGEFRNNGLQNSLTIADFNQPGFDAGRGGITGIYIDHGKFKVPSLRNLAFSGPYMHDGRFATLSDVVDFYSTSVHITPFTDPSMKPGGGVHLTNDQKNEVIAFLQALTDSTLVTNPDYSNPFQQ